MGPAWQSSRSPGQPARLRLARSRAASRSSGALADGKQQTCRSPRSRSRLQPPIASNRDGTERCRQVALRHIPLPKRARRSRERRLVEAISPQPVSRATSPPSSSVMVFGSFTIAAPSRHVLCYIRCRVLVAGRVNSLDSPRRPRLHVWASHAPHLLGRHCGCRGHRWVVDVGAGRRSPYKGQAPRLERTSSYRGSLHSAYRLQVKLVGRTDLLLD
jgi:hypothetical protein